MKKKTFTSTAEALAYIIKRIDGTEVVIGDVEEEDKETSPTSSTKKLWVRTHSVQSYESNFIMEVPNDAPNFANFGELVSYLDSIGKVANVGDVDSYSDIDLNNYSQYLIPIRGKFAEATEVQTLLFTKGSSFGDSNDPLQGFSVVLVSLVSDYEQPYMYLKATDGYTLTALSYDNDKLIYADDFAYSAD